MKKKLTHSALLLSITVAVGTSGCGSSAGNEDHSTSGSVASAAGGAVAATTGGGASAFFDRLKSRKGSLSSPFENLFRSPHEASHPIAFQWILSAYASVACPTIAAGGTGCSVAGTTATLTYSGCSFGEKGATWNGSQSVAFTGATPVCGSPFPTTQTQVVRTFGAGTTRTSKQGAVVAIDSSGNVTAADGNTYSGGVTITSNGSGVRTGISISGIDLVSSGRFSHTLTTSAGAGGAPLVLSGGDTITSGTVVTFHNLARVKATSTFSNVVFSPSCCTPVSGTITTTFSRVSGLNPLKDGYERATETMTFKGCGFANYSGPEGFSGEVTLGHCF